MFNTQAIANIETEYGFLFAGESLNDPGVSLFLFNHKPLFDTFMEAMRLKKKELDDRHQLSMSWLKDVPRSHGSSKPSSFSRKWLYILGGAGSIFYLAKRRK